MKTDLEANANVVELFERAAKSRAGAPAIVGPAGQVLWSFGELAEVGARLAGALARLDVGPGDRVLVLEPDPRRRHAIVAGVLWAGATLTVPPASLPPWQAIATAATSRPRLVIFEPRLWPIVLAHPALRDVGLRATAGGPKLPGTLSLQDLGAAPIDPVLVPDGAIALASFTTGSTGCPKLVVRSHGVLRAQHHALQSLRGLSADDRDLVGLPMLVLHNLGSGVTSILPPSDAGSSHYGTAVRESIARARPTSAVGFPHLFEAAAGATGVANGRSGLRVIQLGGSRVTGELLAALRSLAPAARVDVVYGSTEVEPIASIGAAEYLAALSASEPASGVCVGRPVNGLELRIEPLAGAPVEGPGQAVGSVHVRGRHAAAEAGASGWVSLGDLGWTDPDGRLWLLGRTANAIGRLLPYEVELAVERLAGVRRAALVRLDGGGGPRAVVAAEPRPGSAASRRGCEVRIGALARERGWPIAGLVVGRLPVVRGPSAKVDLRRLARTGSARWRYPGARLRSREVLAKRPSPFDHR